METVFERMKKRDRERKREIRNFEKRNRISGRLKVLLLIFAVIILFVILH